MSRILIPSKPSWKITIVVDSMNQAQIAVEDMQAVSVVSGIPGVPYLPRQMNQLELSIILTSLVSSTLANTLIASRKESDAPKKSNPH